MTPVLRAATVLAVLLPLVACSTGQKAVYLDTRSSPPLEVPPEMTQPRGDGALTLPEGVRVGATRAGAGESLQANVRLQRDGALRWLEIDAPPEALWPRLVAFWENEGFDIVVHEPEIGVLETDWRENRAGLPRGLLGRMYSADIRDKYRVRVEAGRTQGTSELTLTHRGLREEGFEGVGTQVTTFWQWRPSDPELEAEMLQRLLRFLGLPEQSAARYGETGTVAASEAQALRLAAPRERAWRQVGLALDRLGAEFQRRDAQAGVYEVSVQTPRARGATAPAQRYHVELQEQGGETRVQVRALDGEGTQPLLDALAERLG
ncbi:outer membrane protein assembly factor BamC [Ectothiorhodospiraceae bacterium 2226]|nr:outer membrane protein assembly factor BamC [Ectothiorhodospiraceae bacterium 2226]